MAKATSRFVTGCSIPLLVVAGTSSAFAAAKVTQVDCGRLNTYAARLCSSKAYNDPTHWGLFCLSDGTVLCCHQQDNGANSCSQVQGMIRRPGGYSLPPNVGVLPPPNPPSKIDGGRRPPKSGGTKQPPPDGGTKVGVKPVRQPPSNSGNKQPPSGGTTTIYERGSGKH